MTSSAERHGPLAQHGAIRLRRDAAGPPARTRLPPQSHSHPTRTRTRLQRRRPLARPTRTRAPPKMPPWARTCPLPLARLGVDEHSRLRPCPARPRPRPAPSPSPVPSLSSCALALVPHRPRPPQTDARSTSTPRSRYRRCLLGFGERVARSPTRHDRCETTRLLARSHKPPPARARALPTRTRHALVPPSSAHASKTPLTHSSHSSSPSHSPAHSRPPTPASHAPVNVGVLRTLVLRPCRRRRHPTRSLVLLLVSQGVLSTPRSASSSRMSHLTVLRARFHWVDGVIPFSYF
ncbi:hypothetical protein B0H16DRAFT_1734280 [Mycena metata]|uniref:Uncharacterized protein n=1 Tax=Mycena metata TaxID=1033252 RepID=A0AAD7HWF9_9AGAR|nr:hypothetical protein B0H16DRAFT_1734280 [Mycena metata]